MNLLNPYAIDSNGNCVSIEHARKGQYYSCPKCGEPLSYCKKGYGPHARQNHFKHKKDSNCSGYTLHESESAIHKIAKESIYSILFEHIENKQDFNISWECSDCHLTMKANLLRRAKSVQMELDLGVVRPDVAILDENGNTIIAIEVVFTHDIESETMEFYNNHNIAVVRILIHSAEDCNNIMQKLQHPDSVNYCINLKCFFCQSMKFRRQIIPLLNDDNKYYAVAVGVFNPFDNKPFCGLPFTDQDYQNANQFVKTNFERDTNLRLKNNNGFYFATFVKRFVVMSNSLKRTGFI